MRFVRHLTVARGAVVIAALLTGVYGLWTLAGSLSAETYDTTVTRAEPTLIATGGGPRHAGLADALRVTWRAPDGSEAHVLVRRDAELATGDHVTVTRSRLTGDVVTVIGPTGPVVDETLPAWVSALLLVVGAAAAVIALRLPGGARAPDD